MVKYSCERCGKEFSQKSHYDSHNKRKTLCEDNSDKIKALINKVVEEKFKKFEEKFKKFEELNYKKLIFNHKNNISNMQSNHLEQKNKIKEENLKKKLIY